MDEITSTEFRKTYAQLREAVTVVVLGHPIGMWIPVNAEGFAPIEVRGGAVYKTGRPETKIAFNSKPFTPVPKKGK